MNYKVYGMNALEKDIPPSDIDGFIFFSTLEDRSWNVIERLIGFDKLPKEVFALSLENTIYSDNFEDEKYNGILFEHSEINADLSMSLLPCLMLIHKYVLNKNVIGLDISVMPTPIFSQILHFLIEKHSDKKFVIYYTEPAHYNLDNLFDFNSFDGEIDIKSIPGFEGKTAQANDSQRVIFYLIGFEMNYLNKLIPQQINPDRIVPINGFPSYFPKYKDISMINNDVNYHELDVQVIFAEANNPFETYNQISGLQKRYNTYCIDIIPAGSKPMALGACLFALKQGNNDIRVLYPFPTRYENQKSIGNGKIWEYII